MFCANCGTKQNEGEKFCPNCGTKFEEPLKAEVTKVEEVSKSEASKPENIVLEKIDDTVLIENQTTKEEKSVSVQNEGSESIIETHSTKDKGAKVEIIEQPKNRSIEKTNKEDDKQEFECSDNEIKNTYNDECNNIVLPQIEDNKELSELIREAEKNNVEAQMRLAVKYEFGLGVAVDVDKAQLLYSKIKENIAFKSLVSLDINTRTGVVSDVYKIEYELLYDSEQEEKMRYEERKQQEEIRKQKEKKRIQQKEKLKDIKNKFSNDEYKVVSFSVMIDATSNQTKELIEKINEYNNIIKDYNYDNIIFDKLKSLVTGRFEKKYMWSKRGLFSFWGIDENQRESGFGYKFVHIYEFCLKLEKEQ